MKVLNDVRNTNKILPFVASQEVLTNDFLKNECICKESLGLVFGIGSITLQSLVKYVPYHTHSIHGLTSRVTLIAAQFVKHVLPLLFLRMKSFP